MCMFSSEWNWAVLLPVTLKVLCSWFSFLVQKFSIPSSLPTPPPQQWPNPLLPLLHHSCIYLMFCVPPLDKALCWALRTLKYIRSQVPGLKKYILQWHLVHYLSLGCGEISSNYLEEEKSELGLKDWVKFIYRIYIFFPYPELVNLCQKEKISSVVTMCNNFQLKGAHTQGADISSTLESPSHFLCGFFTDIRGLSSASQLEQLNKRYWYICQDFTEYKYTHQPNRFPDLMMCLPEIRYIAGNILSSGLSTLPCFF